MHGRQFPWRQEREPFGVLLAELLLHRTRADAVAAVFPLIRRRWPTAAKLADADVATLLTELRPLGFSHRSRRIHQLAKTLVSEHAGTVPRDRASLLALPGVGPYIANAVMVIAYGAHLPLVDPNSIRVVSRVFGYASARARPRDDPVLWDFVQTLVPAKRAADFGLALVDLGALVCLPKRPRCSECPLRGRCLAVRAGD